MAHAVSANLRVRFLLPGLRDASDAMSVDSPGHGHSRHVNGPLTWCTIALPAEDFTEPMWTH
jgi:hypothetical protein